LRANCARRPPERINTKAVVGIILTTANFMSTAIPVQSPIADAVDSGSMAEPGLVAEWVGLDLYLDSGFHRLVFGAWLPGESAHVRTRSRAEWLQQWHERGADAVRYR
jgi:hypothetical protein